MRQESKRDVTEKMHERYLKASRKEKGRLVEEFVELTGYHPKHAQVLLRHGPPRRGLGLVRAGRLVTYGPRVVVALKVAAQATDWICGKRLVAALPKLVPALEREGALRLTPQTREQLLSISAATIDRKLSAAKRREKPRGASTTKPGSLLKKQIPVRVYTPWDEQRPGFVEIDLVAHCGQSTAGEYINTLTAVDVATGWTETEPALNKGQRSVFEALERIRTRLPFPLLGIDSDNGTEFINDHLFRYCERHKLTFTRCRAYHKNDQAHVEQKNYGVVRAARGLRPLRGRGSSGAVPAGVCALQGAVQRRTAGHEAGIEDPCRGEGDKGIRRSRHTFRASGRGEGCRQRGQSGVRGPDAGARTPSLTRRIDAELGRLWQLQAGAEHTVSAVS